MASESPDHSPNNEYFIIRPEKIRLIDVLTLLIFRRSLTSYAFVETSEKTRNDLRNVHGSWITDLTVSIQKALAVLNWPMKLAGIIIEFLLNLFALNGGILGLLWKLITFKVVFPKRDAANYRSMIGFVDGRTDLQQTSSLLKHFPVLGNLMENKSFINYFSSLSEEARLGEVKILELTMMAAKIAYENEAYINNVVTNKWKMHFVGFYDCWNKFLKANTTQAFICCNKAENADLIVLAFRGTEPFNAQDWSTDVDLSWLNMGITVGSLHLGFLKALGLQDEKSGSKGFPKDFTPSAGQQIAYYTIREELRKLLKANPNAKIIVTGHSLGGALAVIFPALLAMHGQSDILKSLLGVFTYGQPRVGDRIFKLYFARSVRCSFYRMVYRYDIVPRVPFDLLPVSLFTHGGKCVYYDGWYKGKVLDGDVPNPNYFNPMYMVSMYMNAWGDLFKGMFMGWTQGKDYKEGVVSILFRSAGLVLPGIASHSPRDYVNAGRLANITAKEV